MKLIDCLFYGIRAGLKTVGEAKFNIIMHRNILFVRDEVQNELDELNNEYELYGCHDVENIIDTIEEITIKQTKQIKHCEDELDIVYKLADKMSNAIYLNIDADACHAADEYDEWKHAGKTW